MATVGLTPTCTPTRRRFRKSRRSSRDNASFTVSADASLTLNDQVFRPHVTYSVKKQGRWRLLEAASKNPGSLFDDNSSTTNLQLTVANAARTQNGSRFYHRDESHTVDLGRKRLNIPSLRRMMALNEGSSNPAPTASVDFLDTREQRHRRQKQLPGSPVLRKMSVNRKRMSLANFGRDMALCAEDDWDDEEDEEEEEEEEEVEEEDLCDALISVIPDRPTTTPRCSSLDPVYARSQSPVPDDFVVVAEAETLRRLPDDDDEEEEEEGCIPTVMVSLPSSDLSATALRALFDGAFVDGPDQPRLFAVDISERLFSTRRPLHAYVVFQAVGDQLAVRLNCLGARRCRLSALGDVGSVAAVVDACVEACADHYRRCPPAVQRSEKIVTVSGFAVPADRDIALHVVPADEEYATGAAGDGPASAPVQEEQLCGVCFDAVQPGRFSVLSSCRHPFCAACWRRHLLMEISAGRSDLRCPSFGCQRSVDLATRLRFVPVDQLRSHHRHSLSARMDSNPDLVWCPRAACSRAIRLPGLSQLPPLPVNAVCSCDTAFCPHCRQEAHWPAPCDVYRAFADELERLGDRWRPVWSLSSHTPLQVRAKPCPNCGRLWEKNGGCNHMTCPSCGASFCWFCGVRESEHLDGFPCGDDRKKEEELPAQEFVIRPTFTALHLRRLAEQAALPDLRRRYARLLHRAVVATGAGTAEDKVATAWALCKALFDVAQAAQFALVTAVSSQAHAEEFRASSEQFESLAVSALEGLRSLTAAETPRNRSDALRRLRACQEEGEKASRQLQAVLISGSEDLVRRQGESSDEGGIVPRL